MASHIHGYRDGTVAERLNLPTIRALPVLIPPLAEQRAIAHILGALDDKIELNRRMNETLEAMARALFKSWFVDFDPVRAKAEGRDPGLPKAIADLFPDSFEDSDLGEIPKGWEIKSIGDLADVAGGTTPSTKEPAYWDGGTYAWATPKDLSGLSVPVLLDTERRITDAGLSQIGSGLLPKGTVLLSSRAPIGYLAVVEIPVAINQGFIAMTPRLGTTNLFLFLWASVAHEEIVSRANGSTFLEISKANFRDVHVHPGDCNRLLLEKVFPQARYEDYRRALCILDPYGLHLDWKVITEAGRMRSVDIFLNFPVADINRNVLWRDRKGVAPDQMHRMSVFWGDDTWREAAYKPSPQMSLLGPPDEEKASNAVVAEAFRQRLKQVAGFKHVPVPIAMRNSHNAIVYYLFFASQKPVAEEIVMPSEWQAASGHGAAPVCNGFTLTLHEDILEAFGYCGRRAHLDITVHFRPENVGGGSSGRLRFADRRPPGHRRTREVRLCGTIARPIAYV